MQHMSIALERGLSILEHLARYPQGLPITMIATELDIPLSGIVGSPISGALLELDGRAGSDDALDADAARRDGSA